jgi:NTP pyrophosphatase (non-canonical NTP hydrolase)
MADLSDLQKLQKRVIAFRDARDWEQFHSPKDEAVSLLLEAAEFLEHFQWKSSDEIKDHLDNRRESVGDELSDVLYWVLLIAYDLKIDIPEAFERKMKQNEIKYPVAKAKGSHKKYTEL